MTVPTLTDKSSQGIWDGLPAAIDQHLDDGGMTIGATTAAGVILGSTGSAFGASLPVTPDGVFHVHRSSAGAVTGNANQDDIVVEGAGATGVSVLVPDSVIGTFGIGSPTNNAAAVIDWRHSTLAMRVGTNIASGTLDFYAGAFSHHMRLQAGGGLKIASPTTLGDGQLHVHEGSAGAVTAPTTADDLVVENVTTPGISILGTATTKGLLNFGTPTDSTAAGVEYDPNNKTLSLGSYTGTGISRLMSGSGVRALRCDPSQNVELGPSGALATTATNGFVYLPTCAGAPTGVPTAITGKVASVYDTTNERLYVYNAGWKSVVLA